MMKSPEMQAILKEKHLLLKQRCGQVMVRMHVGKNRVMRWYLPKLIKQSVTT
ncbi:hypothetical protein ICE98_02958 [Lactococcus lactis]|nr:hypothetical protein [Lactococcus lactis]